jgi:RNA polymerase sigma-54 factor
MNDRQVLIQEQRQEQRQMQTLSQQQVLHAQLVELPITQLLERIDTEMNDNPALEASTEGQDYRTPTDEADFGEPPATADDYDAEREREERQSALDAALENIGRDDEDLPVYYSGAATNEEHEETVFGNITSFYDQMNDQVRLLNLTEHERDIMEYLIGSLDDDGLLRKPLDAICEELAVYHGIDTTTAEAEQVLLKLQQLDPAGIGARSLQECLLLQIERRDESRVKQLMQRVIGQYFDDFTKKHWSRIQRSLKLSDLQAEALFGELRRLNPKPGASMGEATGRSLHQITPDFIVDTQDDGTITFSLNQNEVPDLKVSQSFADSMKTYQQDKENISRQTKEALLYIKRKVDAAQVFIDAIRMRQRTLTLTMQTIIQLQRQFFLDGDDASLRPMILKDVAERTGLDISTVSRVCNSKYAQTRWGIFPLRHFFSDGYVTEQGEELSTHQLKAALREIIDSEDKNQPLTDDALTQLMNERGYTIARRTVAKYREQMGYPIARMRR